MIPSGEIAPACQGFAVAASTPVADISSSTDPMEEDQPRPSFVQVQNQTLNELNVSADPAIVLPKLTKRLLGLDWRGNSQAQVADVQRTAQERVEL